MHGDGRDNPGPGQGTESGATLAQRLAVVAAGPNRFVSARPADSSDGRGTATGVFGGLLVAQGLGAAAATVSPAAPARALHASFLRAGRAGEALWHEVEPTRDGTSFATRRVVVGQGDRQLLVLTAEFHRPEPGAGYAPPADPGIPGPEGLAPGRYDGPLVASRDVPVRTGPGPDGGGPNPAGQAPAGPAHARRAWFRVLEALGDEPALHQQALAYLSDHGPTRAAREPHPHLADDTRRQSVSLDHSLWFHQAVDVTGWLLSEMVPAATGAGRGLTLGTIRTRSGGLVATVAQEVLLRER